MISKNHADIVDIFLFISDRMNSKFISYHQTSHEASQTNMFEIRNFIE